MKEARGAYTECEFLSPLALLGEVAEVGIRPVEEAAPGLDEVGVVIGDGTDPYVVQF